MQGKTKSLFSGVYLLWFGVPVFIYQILTTRIISQSFGDLFTVQLLAMVISYAGHALGSYRAHRSRYGLALTHVILAALNIFLVSSWYFADKLIQLPYLGIGVVYLLFFAISYFSAQLFPFFYSHADQSTRRFNALYFAFHFLVVFILFAIDLYGVGMWGLQNIFVALLVADLICAAFWWKKEALLKASHKLQPLTTDDKTLLKKLFLVSIVSGVIQALTYRQVQTVIAPLSVHYSFYLAALMVGWCLASLWFMNSSRRGGFSWNQFVDSTPLLILSLAAWYFSWPALWSWMVPVLTQDSGASLLARVLFVFGLTIPGAFYFGSLMPLAQKEKSLMAVGILLAVNSLGNAAGILLYSAVLFQVAVSSVLWIVLFLLAMIFVTKGWTKSVLYNGTAVVLLVIGLALHDTYNWDLGSYYYRNLNSWIETSVNVKSVDRYRTQGSQVNLVHLSSGSTMMFMNGHYSVWIPPSGKVAPADVMMGLPALHYVPRTDKALLIGLGTGFTALGSASVMKQLDIVDLDPTMVKLTSKLAAKNIFEQPNVHFIHADGLTYLREDQHQYDLIINNVPSPVYFASSKLWTNEAFAAISRSLADDGIFFQWLSGEFSAEDLKIVFQVMNPYFENCDLYVLGYHFHGLVCAKKGQTLHFSEKLAETLSSKLELAPADYLKLLEDISFKNITIPNVQSHLPLNTLDRPTLELQTSLRPPGWSTQESQVDNIFAALGITDAYKAKSEIERVKKCIGVGRWLEFGDDPANCSSLGL